MKSTHRAQSGLLIAVALAAVLVAGTVTFSARPEVARAADGDVTLLAGGTVFNYLPNPVGPVAGSEVSFTVYAQTVEEHNGFVYIRDYNGIYKIDAVSGVTQRIAGTGILTPGLPLPQSDVRAIDVEIPLEDSLAIGLDGDVYFASHSRIYRVDADTGILHIVAGNGSLPGSDDGGPAVDAGLTILYGDLFVDSSDSIWFIDAAFGAYPTRLRRIDAVSGLISTVYEFPNDLFYGELLGFSQDGSAYLSESTFDPDNGSLLSRLTIRVDAYGGIQVVNDPRAACDDTGSVFQWVDDGVLRTITYSDGPFPTTTVNTSGTTTSTSPDPVGVARLCSVDLASGVATQRMLTGSITDYFNDLEFTRIVDMTTSADGVSFFVDYQSDETYGVYRWDDGAPPEPASFVTRSGAQLMFEGQPFRFTGMNLYDANNTGGCGGVYGTGDTFADAIDAMNTPQVIRSWFFQPLATTAGGVRDWTAFDHTLAVAESKGVRIIATLGNQWKDCDGLNGTEGKYKTDAWYAGGYSADIDPGMIVSYRAWVAEVVARYRDNPTIMAWEILNEPEVKTERYAQSCPPNAAGLLYDFTVDISALIKTIDPNHLVSLGTHGEGQCGSDNENFSSLHAIPEIDLCSVHDYKYPNDPIAGDQWNGVAKRLEQCRALNKPVFVGEAGLQLPETGGSTAIRAEQLTAKMSAAFRAGVVGYLLWGWGNPPRVAVTLDDDKHDIGPGDPVLPNLAVAPSLWPNDGGDSDNDGISNAVDSGAGWDDQAGTTGGITNANGLNAVILDAPSPSQGVTIYVPSAGSPVRTMTVSACGVPVEIDSGTWATITCGSITANVATGEVRVRVSSDTFATIPGGTSATVNFEAGGVFTVGNVVGSGVSVTVETTTTSLAAGAAPRSFASWTFLGFSPPVSNTVVNTVVAGKKVTLAWILLDPARRPVKTLQQVTIRVATLASCPGGRVVPDGAPVTLTLNNGLRHLGFGIYVVEWSTPKAFKGSCKELQLDLGEGVTRNAKFRFK